jgi:hypothetical protein
MPSDLATLAEACGVGLPEVHACLLVAGDGSVAVAHPADEQMHALAAWQGLRGLGEVRRGFVTVGRECWAFVMRDRIGALAVLGSTPRLGAVLERLDDLLDQAAPGLEAGAPPADESAERVADAGPSGTQDDSPAEPRWETDTIALVREFAGLLSETDDGEEQDGSVPTTDHPKTQDGAA